MGFPCKPGPIAATSSQRGQNAVTNNDPKGELSEGQHTNTITCEGRNGVGEGRNGVSP
jgi:hypothetical protein